MKIINVIFSNHYVVDNHHTFTIKIKNPNRKTTATVIVNHNGNIDRGCYEKLALHIHSYLAPSTKPVSTISDDHKVTLKNGYQLEIDAKVVRDRNFSIFDLQSQFVNNCIVRIV